jgi:hypothetical protein
MPNVFFAIPDDLPAEWQDRVRRAAAVLREHLVAAEQLVGGLRRLHAKLRELSAQHAALDRTFGTTPRPTSPALADELASTVRGHEASHANLIAARQALRAMVHELAALVADEGA